APPPGFRTPAPQPTSTTSLNYWWPYGPNGVNPTATATFASSSGVVEMGESDTMDNTSTDITSSTSPTMLPSTTFRTSASTTPTTSTKTEETASDNSSQETEDAGPITSGNDAFSAVTLLPLLIILGVLLSATLVGWGYSRCIRQRTRGEPTPGGPDIGGKPYEGSGSAHDTIGPLHSLGVSWVDASRIRSQHNLSSGSYYAIREDPMDGEPGTPSKNKSNGRRGRNWFRHTLSGRKRAVNSPSGEKGLNAPLAYPTYDRRLPVVSVPALRNFGSGPYLSPSPQTQSPKTLRIVSASPTNGLNLLSPVTTTEPTPLLSASRHASLRRKIAHQVREGDNNEFTTTTALAGALGGFNHEGYQDASLHTEDWAIFRGEPQKRSPVRRYMSPNAASTSSVWSPDPEMHRERMHRLRAAAEAAHCRSPTSDLPASLSGSEDVSHPLPPAPAVILSPPLQPHLFFTRAISDDSECDDAPKGAISKLHFTRSDPSRNLKRHSEKDDSFGPRIPLNPTNRRTRKGKARAKGYMDSTGTLPLSPEIRGAAMTKLDEIVKSHWSVRNLAEVPQSPTLYGALGSASDLYGKSEEAHQAGIEAALLASPGTTHT
ncbi:hypothetical protein FRC11_003927, partial [Ceratobasidium sp. 423]